MTTQFPMHARSGDPAEGYMVVQQMVEYLRDVFDRFASSLGRGTATVVAGNTTVIVPIPASVGGVYSVGLTPLVDPTVRYWVTSKTSSGFTINLSAAAPAGGVNFDWIVRGA